MTFLTELQTESVRLHSELEKLTELSRSFDGEFFDMILVRKEYIKTQIEHNLNLQFPRWLEKGSENKIVKLYFDNPGMTGHEIGRRCNVTHSVVSRALTKNFKLKNYGQNNLRA